MLNTSMKTTKTLTEGKWRTNVKKLTSNSRPTKAPPPMKPKTYTCKSCGEESKWSHQKMNVYCSTRCAGDGKLQESIERFKRGELTGRITIRKVLATLRGYNCEVCNISEWNGKEIVLNVDHIDGRSDDNSPENLRLICANCHSQTPSYCGRNVGQGRESLGLSRSS